MTLYVYMEANNLQFTFVSRIFATQMKIHFNIDWPGHEA